MYFYLVSLSGFEQQLPFEHESLLLQLQAFLPAILRQTT